MWVTLAHREGEFYHGHVNNEPKTRGSVSEGMGLWFRAEHVIDYAGPNGENQASERADAVQCNQHGISHTCYVCEHLTPEAPRRGFNFADTDSPRPDAWCDECQKEFARTGSWESPGTREPSILIVCGGCYDALKERHSRSVDSDPAI
jgi:hypothetical protein